MIIVRLMGGLGNQMFQYAAGLRLAHRHQAQLKLDLTFLLDRTPRLNFTYRDFDLEIFNLQIKIATEREVMHYRGEQQEFSTPIISKLTRYSSSIEHIIKKLTKKNFYIETHPAFDPLILNLPNNTYLEGYFQDERYFKDIESEIRRIFRIKLDETKLPDSVRLLADEIRNSNAACIHVRRGDYIAHSDNINLFGSFGLEYYMIGLRMLEDKGFFGPIYVFSDDEKWCREHFSNSARFKIVSSNNSGPKASFHFWLMTLCRHFIISNSTFAWWAAWLSSAQDKIVCRPNPWFLKPDFNSAIVCPNNWLEIKRSGLYASD